MYRDIWAVLVTWNPDFELLINNIKHYSRIINVVVVDNGSKLGVRDLIESLNSDFCNVISLGDNKGIAFALNKGVEYALKKNAKYFLFLDQDSKILDDTISILKAAIEELSGNWGDTIVGPVPRDRDSGERIGIYRVLDNSPSRDKYIEFESIYTSGMLVPKDVAIRNPQREEFFIDYVDTEWCFRIRNDGVKIFVVKNAEINHKVGESEIKIPFLVKKVLLIHKPIRQYYQIRNSIWMLRSSYIPLKRRVNIFFRCLVRVLLIGFLVAPRAQRVRLIFLGIFDGFFGGRKK